MSDPVMQLNMTYDHRKYGARFFLKYSSTKRTQSKSRCLQKPEIQLNFTKRELRYFFSPTYDLQTSTKQHMAAKLSDTSITESHAKSQQTFFPISGVKYSHKCKRSASVITKHFHITGIQHAQKQCDVNQLPSEMQTPVCRFNQHVGLHKLTMSGLAQQLYGKSHTRSAEHICFAENSIKVTVR